MTAILALACFVSGFTGAWLLREVCVMARISRSQERMQRKVRHWQREAINAQALAEQLTHLLPASTVGESKPPDWPAAGIG